MSDLADLAADLAYAAGPGAAHIRHKTEDGAEAQAKVNSAFDQDTTPAGAFGPTPTPTQSAEQVAGHAAVEAANLGAQLVVRRVGG